MHPLYHVHWNNLAPPLKFEAKTPGGVTVSPKSGEAPKVDVESDLDPREFLLELEKTGSGQPLEVTVKYFACNDEEGWCKAVSQGYRVHLEVDRDGGNARRGGGLPPSAGARRALMFQSGGNAVGQRRMGMVVRVDAEGS